MIQQPKSKQTSPHGLTPGQSPVRGFLSDSPQTLPDSSPSRARGFSSGLKHPSLWGVLVFLPSTSCPTQCPVKACLPEELDKRIPTATQPGGPGTSGFWQVTCLLREPLRFTAEDEPATSRASAGPRERSRFADLFRLLCFSLTPAVTWYRCLPRSTPGCLLPALL